MGPQSPPLSVARGRLLIVLAALLWSTSGAFLKVTSTPTRLGLHEPRPAVLQLAALRVLFAGIVLLPLLRPRDVSFRPALAVTAVSFAVMNALFIAALSLGTAANAILLQYTAPMWMFLFSVWWMGEQADRRGAIALAIGLVGIALIVFGGWKGGELVVVLLALGSGVAFAGVILGLRFQRGASTIWLTVVNHLFGGLVLLPFLFFLPPLAPRQYAWLFAFGALQMALPYVLMARGLRAVSPQEAGTLTLLEPLLNPLWAYLVSPETETPGEFTLYGGACVLGALVYRYWPTRPAPHQPTDEPIRRR